MVCGRRHSGQAGGEPRDGGRCRMVMAWSVGEGPVGAKARSGEENLAVSSWLSIWGIGSEGVSAGQ